MNSKQKILSVLDSLIGEDYEQYPIMPASEKQISIFRKRAESHGLEKKVTDELVSFYEIADGFNYEIVLGFHPCDDELIFEWWDEKTLWLGSRDFYVVRWVDGKYCLGDSSHPSFSKEFEFSSFVEFLDACVWEIRVNMEKNKL
ncbi:MAG TPA: hypothetical protein PL048_07885 [Leptospiraceae bacterium]|nr:hypothetical protein [Leptospiraceae bacterium]HMY65407.1 hypothetical protein [Leptospiraceae bacterium]HMZ58680.1 hypothetical protein [Leptospiraceae bacterium]HNH07905.1 hypothetical protein [Leptospiraceae bacterium]HNN02482.1 hypothetical protein [Leptospiraceae bacterium]